mgnify:CR=1 FL=1
MLSVERLVVGTFFSFKWEKGSFPKKYISSLSQSVKLKIFTKKCGYHPSINIPPIAEGFSAKGGGGA